MTSATRRRVDEPPDRWDPAGSVGPDGSVGPAGSVLVFGPIGALPGRRGIDVVDPGEAARVQLEQQYDLGVISVDVWEPSCAQRRRLLLHTLVAHLRPGAWAVIHCAAASAADTTEHARACGLEPVPAAGPLLFRRTDRVTVHDLVAQARSGLVRLAPVDLAARLGADDGCQVLDTRSREDRERFGTIPGSRHVPRNSLEWRVDPASGYSEDDLGDLDQCLVLVCNDGYSSSLAAASLQRLGFRRATDLRGGFRAWLDAGLPVAGAPHEGLPRAETSASRHIIPGDPDGSADVGRRGSGSTGRPSPAGRSDCPIWTDPTS